MHTRSSSLCFGISPTHCVIHDRKFVQRTITTTNRHYSNGAVSDSSIGHLVACCYSGSLRTSPYHPSFLWPTVAIGGGDITDGKYL
jgi:hypothetical protein